jgi:spore coat protein SA
MRATAPANVRFEPYCSGNAMAEKFREADIYCLPSCWNDPFPLTVLEAMASEVPVVASRSGGIPEQLADGGGVLIARNSAPELAVALIRLALDPKMRRELGTRGLTSFRKNFTWESVHATYRRILEPEVTLQGPVESSQYVS